MEESDIVEQTTADSQPEEQTLDETSSEVETQVETEDTSPEEAPETEIPEAKHSRAKERIESLVRERNYYKELANKKQVVEPTFEGIDETGIDPVKFGESLNKQAQSVASKAARMEIEALRAEQDFPEIKTSRILQNAAKAYISEGFNPYEAAAAAYDDFKLELKSRDEAATKKVRADKNLRSASFTPSGQQSGTAEHVFTDDEIASMDSRTYEANKEKILKQYGIK